VIFLANAAVSDHYSLHNLVADQDQIEIPIYWFVNAWCDSFDLYLSVLMDWLN